MSANSTFLEPESDCRRGSLCTRLIRRFFRTLALLTVLAMFGFLASQHLLTRVVPKLVIEQSTAAEMVRAIFKSHLH